MKITEDTYTIKIPESVQIREKVFEAILDWMVENGAYSGEIVMQCDECIISAPQLLSYIIDDIIKPEIKENEII